MSVAVEPGGRVEIWDVAARQKRQTLAVPGGQAPQAFSFSPDGRVLAVISGPLSLWDVATGRPIEVGEAVGVIAALDEQADQLIAAHQLVVAQAVKDGLDFVGEANDGFQTKHAGRALDGVRAAKQGIQIFVIERTGFCAEQDFLHLRQQFVAFFEERGHGLG